MLVYVLNKHGKPLMPCKPSKARKLLKQGKAKVVKRDNLEKGITTISNLLKLYK